MLNVKYIILDKEVSSPDFQLIYSSDKTFVYLNRSALPRTYFVNQVTKKSGVEIINMVKNGQFDPRDIAFTDEEINGIEAPDSSAFVKIEKFEDEIGKLLNSPLETCVERSRNRSYRCVKLSFPS